MKRNFLQLSAVGNLAISKSLQESFNQTQKKYDELSPLLADYEALEEKFLSYILAVLGSKITSPELRNFLMEIPGGSGNSLLQFLVEGALVKHGNADMSHYTHSSNITVAGFHNRQDFIPALKELSEAWRELASIGCDSDVAKEFVQIDLKFKMVVKEPV